MQIRVKDFDISGFGVDVCNKNNVHTRNPHFVSEISFGFTFEICKRYINTYVHIADVYIPIYRDLYVC